MRRAAILLGSLVLGACSPPTLPELRADGNHQRLTVPVHYERLALCLGEELQEDPGTGDASGLLSGYARVEIVTLPEIGMVQITRNLSPGYQYLIEINRSEPAAATVDIYAGDFVAFGPEDLVIKVRTCESRLT